MKGGRGDRLGGESASGCVPTAAIPLERVANAVEEFDSIIRRLALGCLRDAVVRQALDNGGALDYGVALSNLTMV